MMAYPHEPEETFDDPMDVEDLKDFVSARKAWVDQAKMDTEKSWDSTRPRFNQVKLDSIAMMEFRIQIDEWEICELEKMVADSQPDEAGPKGDATDEEDPPYFFRVRG